MFNVPPQLRPYSRSSAGSDSLETSSINGFTLSDELIAFYQATDGLNLSQLDTDVLTLEAASAYARDLDYHPLSQGGCAEFCVNGQSTAGVSRPVRKHNEHQETRRTRRTAVWPAGQLQEA